MTPEQPADYTMDDERRRAIESLLVTTYGHLTSQEVSIYTRQLRHLTMQTIADAEKLQQGTLNWELDLLFQSTVLDPENAEFRARLLIKLQEIDSELLDPHYFGSILEGGVNGTATAEDVDDHYAIWTAVLILGKRYGPLPIISLKQEGPLTQYLIANKSKLVDIIAIIRERRVLDPAVINDLLMDGSVLREGAL